MSRQNRLAKKYSRLTRGLFLGLSVFLTACASFEPADGLPANRVDTSHIPLPQPREEPRSRYGNPESYEVFGVQYQLRQSRHDYRERGIASWYGTKFHGRRTSSGEPYDMYAFTAAHKTLPIPVFARVTNLENGRQIIVRINDRGPFHPNRIIDLSYTAAVRLDMLGKGTALVEVETIDPKQNATLQASSDPSLAEETQANSHPAPLPLSAVETSVNTVKGDDQHNRLYLQVGAFSHADNAEKLRQTLSQQLQQQIRIKPTPQASEMALYRVWIGPLASVQDADLVSKQLLDAGYTQTHIIID